MLNRIRHSGKKRRAKRFPAFMLAVLLLAGAPAGQLHAGMVWGQEDGGQTAGQTQKKSRDPFGVTAPDCVTAGSPSVRTADPPRIGH